MSPQWCASHRPTAMCIHANESDVPLSSPRQAIPSSAINGGRSPRQPHLGTRTNWCKIPRVSHWIFFSFYLVILDFNHQIRKIVNKSFVFISFICSFKKPSDQWKAKIIAAERKKVACESHIHFLQLPRTVKKKKMVSSQQIQ